MAWLRSTFRFFQPLTDVLLFILAHAALFFCARLALCCFLLPDIADRWAIGKALHIGSKFDMRLAVFMSLPMALCLFFPFLERSACRKGRSLVRTALCSVTCTMALLVMLIYIVDFGFFFYLRQRIDMGVMEFLREPLESALMVWQSYPVPAILLGLAAGTAAYACLLRRFIMGHDPLPVTGWKSALRRTGLAVLAAFVMAVLIYGQGITSRYPLRWSSAYFCTDSNIPLLAINPIQNLYDTRRHGQILFPDVHAAREAWPRMAAWLRVPDGAKPLSYARHVQGRSMAVRPNIVIIIMESLCWERTSLAPSMPAGMGGDIDPTPFLKELAGKSLCFPHFYAPTRTTARAVFTTVSGVPDVNHTGGISACNPRLVRQASVLADLKGYEKYYMLGGDAGWENIQGVIQHNVPDIRLLEAGFWKSPAVDVWGISDIALFREAVDVLNMSRGPFAAVIQTASFHRPYTLPEDNEGFAMPPAPSPEALAWYGFSSAREYQSLRFADHALRRFFEKARRQPWFSNTVFAIFGDHGLNAPSGNITPAVKACGLQAWHVPLLLHAPGGQVAPGVDETLRMQTDVLPTLAWIAGMDCQVRSLGRNMLDPETKRDAAVFISHNDNTRFLLKDGYVYAMFPQGGALYRLDEQPPDGGANDLSGEMPERASSMHRELMDFYHTARYMLHNNGMPGAQEPRARRSRHGHLQAAPQD